MEREDNKNEVIRERLSELRRLMAERNISVYVVPTADYHGSEYVSGYFKEREYITGFTGSAGTAVVTPQEAGLWTDGRYYIQAERQLAGSGIRLFKDGMEGVPRVDGYVREKLAPQTALGFDGRTVTAAEGEKYRSIAKEKGAAIRSDEDLIGFLWDDRPEFPVHAVCLLEEKYSGESTEHKLARIRACMEKEGADVQVLSSLTDIAWVLNVRGNDISHVPVAMSYLLIGKKDCIWYVKPEVFSEENSEDDESGWSVLPHGEAVRKRLAAAGVQIRDYDDFYSDLGKLDGDSRIAGAGERDGENSASEPADRMENEKAGPAGAVRNAREAETEDREGEAPETGNGESAAPASGRRPFTVMLEKGKVNLQILDSIPENVRILDRPDPEEKMKAAKNPTEISHIREAHIKDGVAVTKFLFWLKTHIGKEKITEWSAAEYLENLRRQQEGFLDLSFDTISAWGPNAAMMHYAPSREHEVELMPKGFLLVDSGGHYLEGSTDITRTIALGELTQEEREMFTVTVRACMNLANARFLYGCCGQNLDILARGPFWNLGLDYRCGTGHGNGYLLNVHEGPNGFRWKIVPERRDSGTLEDGMVTTDEPGVYIEGRYGIRIENELVCRKWQKNEYGQFMEFEDITYAPIDLDAVIPEEMTQTERGYLNAYHEKVYRTISPYLTEEEREWLREYTRKI